MFKLGAQRATLEHVSFYPERHGSDEVVTGTALKVSVAMPSTVLDLFAAGLRDVIFSQGTSLRFPEMGAVKWDAEHGAKIVIDDDDLLGERHVAFTDATVDKFQLAPLEGGTVEVTLRVKCKPEAEQMSILYLLLNKEVLLTVDPISPQPVAEPAGEKTPALLGVDE